MPIDAAEVYGTDPSAPAGAAPPAHGISMEEIYGLAPKAPEPSKTDKLKSGVVALKGAAKEELATVKKGVTAGGEAVAKAGEWFREGGENLWKEYSDNVNAYVAELKKDTNAQPEGWGPQVLQSGKVLLDAMGTAFAPLTTGVEHTLVTPIQNKITEIGDKIKAGLKEGKSGNWAMHKEDVTELVSSLNDMVEQGLQTAAGFIGGGESVAARRGATLAKTADELKSARPVERPVDEVPAPTDKPKPRVQVVGKTPEGKPRVRLVLDGPKAQVANAMDDLSPMMATEENISHFKDMWHLKKDWLPTHNVAAPLYLESYTTKTPIGAHAVLDKMLSDETIRGTEYTREFLTKLRAHVDDVPIHFVDEVDTRGYDFKGKPMGMYYQDTHHIEIAHNPHISRTNPETTHIVAHEMVHAATVRFILMNPESPLVKELNSLYIEGKNRLAKMRLLQTSEVFDRYKTIENPDTRARLWKAFGESKPTHYGLKNVREFVAEAMTSPTFQRFLAKSDEYASKDFMGLKNLWNRMAGIIGRMMGLKPSEGQLLHRTMDLTNRIMEQQEEFYHGPEMREIRGDDVLSAMEKRELPGEKNLAGWIDWLNRNINPEGLGPKAKMAAAVVAHRMAVAARETAVYKAGAAIREKYWKLNPEKISEFLDGMESGKRFENPQLEEIRQTYKVWARNIFERDTLWTGVHYEPKDNYMPHLFEEPEAVSDYLKGKYRRWGDPSFIKERSYAMIKDAVAAGFKLKYKTPEEMMLARQSASDLAEMRENILRDMNGYGLAIESEGQKQPPGTTPRRSPSGKKYWVNNQAYAILFNAFDSKSLWADTGPVGQTFRGLSNVKNAIVSAKLAVSLFHPLHVLGIDNGAVISRAMEGAMTGNVSPVRLLSEFVNGATLHRSFWSHPRMGGRLIRAFDDPEMAKTMSESDRYAIQLMLEGGFMPHLDSVYKSAGEVSLKQAVTNLGPKSVWQLPLALIAAMRTPIFEWWIPNLKAASFAKDAATALKMDPTLIDNVAKRKLRMREIGKSIDNRYGEMNYNNLFWNRRVKDLAVLDTLSLGWQLGFLREYGGGALDLGKFTSKVLRGETFDALKGGQLHKPLFVAAYTTMGGMYAGLMTWGLTGTEPHGWMDYVYPRTGDKNPDGTDKRVNTMFYSREFPAIAKHMDQQGVFKGLTHLAASKGSGLYGLMAEWATGLNSFGQEIADPDAPIWKRTAQKLAYSLTDLEPISVKAMRQSGDVKGAALAIGGFTPVAKYITATHTQGAIQEAYQRYVAPSQTPYDKAMFSDDMRALRAATGRDDSKADEILTKMQDQYGLNYKEMHRLQRSIEKNEDPSIVMFKRLDWHVQKKLLDAMSPEDRETYLPHSNKTHLRQNYEEPQE